jgi:hypothetical protein
VILVNVETIRKAEALVQCCEQCHPEKALLPFDWLLAKVTGKHGKYVMTEPARCPACQRALTDQTLVEPK